MSRLHICNTFFERELEKRESRDLLRWMQSSPIVLQLQFLPLLYAAKDDRILVSALPENPDPRLCLIENPPTDCSEIEHWGPSLAISEWAKKHKIPYSLPDWNWVRQVNSKIFSFLESPQLPGAKILNSPEEIEEWVLQTPGPKVLKTPFGTAGGGHTLILEGRPKKISCPVIGEPWVERVLDFSTQWKNGELLGVTLFENEPNGTYKSTYVEEVEPWALEEHLSVSRPLIQKLFQMGYSGNMGVDAFIYLWEGKKRVHPVVEINARKTMSWVALQRKEKRLSYLRSSEGLLPNCLKNKQFSRNLL